MRVTVLALALLIGSGIPVEAQSPVGSFADLWMRLRTGDRVSVTDGSGLETGGVFLKVSDTTLSILVDGQSRDIPSAGVREIAKQGDSVLDGLWKGAAIGGGIGLVFGAIVLSGDDVGGYLSDEATMGIIVGGSAAYGTGIGALIDYFHKGHTVVFRVKGTALRLRPELNVERRGVSASMAFSTR